MMTIKQGAKMKKVMFIITILFSGIFLLGQSYTNVKVLIWDNDMDYQYISPESQEIVDYETNFLISLNEIGFNEEMENIDIVRDLPEKKVLEEYAVIFIINGHRDADMMIDNEDIKNLENYLKKGGCIYIEGNNIVEFLSNDHTEFLNDYFNVILYSDNIGYAYCDTLNTNENSGFSHSITFAYPKGQEPDIGIDEIGPYRTDLQEPYFFDVLHYETNEKMYKSTAAAYAHPLKETLSYRTFIQTVNFSALHSSTLLEEDGIILRTEYLKTILRFFGIGKTLIAGKGDFDIETIQNMISYDSEIEDFNNKFLNFKTMIKYSVVFLALGEGSYIENKEIKDIDKYLSHGGKILVILGDEIIEFGNNKGSNGNLYDLVNDYEILKDQNEYVCIPTEQYKLPYYNQFTINSDFIYTFPESNFDESDILYNNVPISFSMNNNLNIIGFNPISIYNESIRKSFTDHIIKTIGGFNDFVPIKYLCNELIIKYAVSEHYIYIYLKQNANNNYSIRHNGNEVIKGKSNYNEDTKVMLEYNEGNYTVIINNKIVNEFVIKTKDINISAEFKDNILYLTNNSKIALLQLYDNLGRCVIQESVYTQINLNHIKSGVYYAIISSGEKILKRKILKI